MLKENIQVVRESINEICIKNNKKIDEITLIGVTKTLKPDIINQAIEMGITDIGENKVQELMDKYFDIIPVRWHLIGHLQKNKVKYIIDKVCLIHSVDDIELAKEIDKRAAQKDIIANILIQVNVSGEKTKFGIDIADTQSFIEEVSLLPNVRVMGLMTIAPHYDDAELTRPIFKRLKELQIEISQKNITNVDLKYLSMGMSNDYKIALEEGANLIRIGTGIFGKRDYNINI